MLILLFISSIAEMINTPLSCSKYQCSNKSVESEFFSNQCIWYDSTYDVHYINPCGTGFECQPVKDRNSYCALAPEDTTIAYPGERCEVDGDCIYGTCYILRCEGINRGEACESNLQCESKLFWDADQKICLSQYEIGEVGCKNDYECVNNASCDVEPGKAGVCLEQLSKKPGEVVQRCYDGFQNYLCENITCAADSKSGAYICTGLLTSAKTIPVPCVENSDCKSVTSNTNTTVTIESTCSCGYNQYGNSYCSQFPGDEEQAQYLALIKQWINSPYPLSCNTERRYDIGCIKSNWDTERSAMLTYYYLRYSQYSQIQENDKCVKSVYTKPYWEAKEIADSFKDNDDDSGFILASFVIALII